MLDRIIGVNLQPIEPTRAPLITLIRNISLSHFVLNAAYLGILSTQMVFAVFLGLWSPGFYGSTSQTPYPCRELLSSGSDDNLAAAAVMFQLIPLIYRLCVFRKPPSTWEIRIFVFCSILSVFGVVLLLECGEVLVTIFVANDPSVALIYIAYPIAFIALHKLRRSPR